MRHLRMLASIVMSTLLTCEASRGQTQTTDVHGDPLPAGALARLGTTRLRHDTPIVFAALLPGDTRVLSASRDGVVCAWEFPSGKLIRRLEAHGAAERPVGFNITGATLSPD